MRLIKKNQQGYGYKYTDLSEITKMLGEEGIDYYQYIEPVDGVDYIMTVITKDGETQSVRRGCRVVEAKLSGKDNPVQAYGAALTYCRRYSLLMAFGLATTDDDAEGFTVKKSEVIGAKEKTLLTKMCKARNLIPDEVFPQGMDLTNEQYADAVKRLSKVPAGGNNV